MISSKGLSDLLFIADLKWTPDWIIYRLIIIAYSRAWKRVMAIVCITDASLQALQALQGTALAGFLINKERKHDK